MNMLTRKDVKWVWEKSQQKAFDELKGVFTTKPVSVSGTRLGQRV